MATERDRRTTPRRSSRSAAPAVALLLGSALVTRSDRAEARPTFDVAYNVGSAAYQQGKHARAAEHLSFALRHWPLLSAVAHLKPTAQQRLATSRAQVGALAVTVSAPLAEELVDGKPAGKAPLAGELFVEPGEHTLEARLDGYAPAQKTVRVAKGETAAVTLAMALAKSEAQAPAGGTTEGGGSAARAGAGGPAAQKPRVAPAEPVAPPEKRSWVPVIALGAASAVGLGVAVGFTVASNGASSDVDTQGSAILQAGGQCSKPSAAFVSRCDELDSSLRRIDTFGNAARLAYVASGALAITAAAYALWGQPREMRTSRIRALPELRTDGAGFAVRGVW